MLKDIQIPEVKEVYIVAISEWNDDFMKPVETVYLLNKSESPLEMLIVVSKAFGEINGEQKESSSFRHVFEKVEPNAYQRIELIEEGLLVLNNQFRITYFIENTMYEKVFTLPANFNEQPKIILPLLNKEGVYAS